MGSEMCIRDSYRSVFYLIRRSVHPICHWSEVCAQMSIAITVVMIFNIIKLVTVIGIDHL